MSVRRFTDEQEAEIAAQYPEKSTTQLAKLYDTTRGTIRRLIVRQGGKAESRLKGGRKLTDEQEAEIAAQYPEKSTDELAKIYDASTTTINNAIKRQGGKLRSISEAQRRFTDEQEQEICQRYLAGENTIQLSKDFGVVSTTITNLLRRHRVPARTLREASGGLTQQQEDDLCRRYSQGEKGPALAEEFGIATSSVSRILERNGTQSRGFIEAHGGVPKEKRYEISRLYTEGKSSKDLAILFGCSTSTIQHILVETDTPRRVRPSGLTDEDDKLIVHRYLQGEGSVSLGREFGVESSSVLHLLRRHGVKIRTGSEACGGLSPEEEAELCRRYEQGESGEYLGKVFGMGNASSYRVLERNGIERRAPNTEYGDSVQHVITGTGRHQRQRECELYLFELARYSDTHCKTGIAFDTDKRARKSDGEYGEEILRLFFSSRSEAYFLEQAVLDATRGSAQCPADLADWAGYSEVRMIPAEDMIPTILRLAAELEELGQWEFAARYVPMTTAQRAICQQRAQTPEVSK